MTTEVPFFDLGGLVQAEADEVHAALDRVLAGGYFVGGPIVGEFERAFADYLGVDHVVGVGNGLDAIRLALEAQHIGPGDEVIVPAFTYYASWLAVVQSGATPVPVEVEHHTANLDPDRLSEAVTENTRAVIAVNLFGQAARLSELRKLADTYSLMLIEDCAQSHGARDGDHMSGTVGHAGAFSFYPTKNLGALGDAGAVATDDPAIAERTRSRRSYGQGASKYDHVDTGWNSRLDPVQAAVLLVHLAKLPEWTQRRREIAAHYRDSLADVAPTSVVGPLDTHDSVWHHFVLRTRDRAEAQTALLHAGVRTDIHYPYSFADVAPMAAYLTETQRASAFPISRRLGQQVLSMPMGPWMTNEQIDTVAAGLRALPRELLAE